MTPGCLSLGAATVVWKQGQIDRHPAEALCVGVNAEGIMASGHAGLVRLAAGADVERDLRAQAPLLLGEAYCTAAGALMEQGVRLIACVVTSEAPGGPVIRDALERGLDRALELLAREQVTTLSIPDVGMRIPNLSVESAAAILADALAARLRRGAALRNITVVSLDQRYLEAARRRLLALGATEAEPFSGHQPPR